jgi:hypothetical protein
VFETLLVGKEAPSPKAVTVSVSDADTGMVSDPAAVTGSDADADSVAEPNLLVDHECRRPAVESPRLPMVATLVGALARGGPYNAGIATTLLSVAAPPSAPSHRP